MNRAILVSAVAAVLLAASQSASARKSADVQPVPTSTWSETAGRDRPERPGAASRLNASAVANTLVLASYAFNSGSTCTAQGWTTVDLSVDDGDYWHVDDFALSNALGTIPPGHMSAEGLVFTPIQGTKSMWMGQRIPPAGPVDTIHCSYLALPGYGTRWDQSFCSKDCLSVAGGATPNLDISFKLKFDVQPSYDATSLEYTTDCSGNSGWIEIAGGNPQWSGADTLTVSGPFVVGPGPVKVRIHFLSDSAYSNQDGLYPGFGVAVDNLSWETTPVEDFEDEAVGALETTDWENCNAGAGNYFALFKKSTGANYFDDGCVNNLSCYWAALQGSTDFYTCGAPPDPTQRVVPYGHITGQNGGELYVANEIWSPVIPFAGTGTDFHLRFSVYRDLPLDNLVFYVWHVRTIGISGCPGPWKDRGLQYYSDTKDWFVADHAVGSKLDVTTGIGMQVALGVVDMRLWYSWSGMGSGDCHSPAPYIDNVQVLRVDVVGPQWDVRDIDTYQDTFATNGTLTGTARIDAALDIRPSASPNFAPGDSAVVLYLVDPKYIVGSGTNANGLLADPTLSTFIGRHKTKKQVYLWAQVWPIDNIDGPGDKVGADLSEGPGGTANRYPFAGTQSIGGNLWTKIRMDYTYTGTALNPGEGSTSPSDPFVANRFNVDLNDNLFTPGDTILYFYSATSADGTTYYSTEYGPTSDLNAVAANPMEVTILPAGGFNRGGSILYVDGADGLGNQPYFDGAFMIVNGEGHSDMIDRYDVRGPSSSMANRLAGRVTNVVAQVNAAYVQGIIWDCGSLPVTLGDGTGNPLKTDDYDLLNTYLANLSLSGGVYLCGDDVAENLAASASASAVTFKSSYMPFILASGNHQAAGLGVSPAIVFWPGRMFNDSFVAFGGCPGLNDFDVMNATGTSRVEMSYNASQSANGAVISNINGNARVLLSGFSFAAIRDDELNGISDRAQYFASIVPYIFGTDVGPPTGAGVALDNHLSQNYPNPFNPQTTIAFSIKQRAHVSLRVYNVAGELVRTLANEARVAGPHTVTWDGRDANGVNVASGVYFYRLVAGEFSQTRKMVLLK